MGMVLRTTGSSRSGRSAPSLSPHARFRIRRAKPRCITGTSTRSFERPGGRRSRRAASTSLALTGGSELSLALSLEFEERSDTAVEALLTVGEFPVFDGRDVPNAPPLQCG